MEELKTAWVVAEQAAMDLYREYLGLKAKADVAKERYREALRELERAK
jgi:hypothetical protein